jgi:hypothetical protein
VTTVGSLSVFRTTYIVCLYTDVSAEHASRLQRGRMVRRRDGIGGRDADRTAPPPAGRQAGTLPTFRVGRVRRLSDRKRAGGRLNVGGLNGAHVLSSHGLAECVPRGPHIGMRPRRREAGWSRRSHRLYCAAVASRGSGDGTLGTQCFSLERPP